MYKFLWVNIIGNIWDNVSAQLNYIQLKYITIVWSFPDILIWEKLHFIASSRVCDRE